MRQFRNNLLKNVLVHKISISCCLRGFYLRPFYRHSAKKFPLSFIDFFYGCWEPLLSQEIYFQLCLRGKGLSRTIQYLNFANDQSFPMSQENKTLNYFFVSLSVSLCHCSQVNRAWNSLASTPSLWQNLCGYVMHSVFLSMN